MGVRDVAAGLGSDGNRTCKEQKNEEERRNQGRHMSPSVDKQRRACRCVYGHKGKSAR